MANRRQVDIEALIREETPVTEAIRLGSLEAMKQYVRAGESMISWRDGKIVRIPPEELMKILEKEGIKINSPLFGAPADNDRA